MTIANQSNRVSAVGNDAVGQAVPFSFPITATSDLKVYQRVTATAVQTTLTETTNYTVAITGDTGGTVTTVTAIASTAEIHVVRDTPNTQSLDLTAGGPWNPERAEDAWDKATKTVIENKDTLARTMRIPQTDATSINMELASSVDRASKYLTFDANGEPAVTVDKTTGTASVSAYGETLIDDANAAAAQTTMRLKDGSADLIINSLVSGGPMVDVTHPDYGAVGDGVTDDTAAFAAALATNNTVFVPYTADFYLLDGGVIRRTSGNMILIGDERRPLLKMTVEGQMFNPDGCAVAVFKNLRFEGTSGTAGDGGIALNLEGGGSSSTTKTIIDNIYCTSFTNYGIRVAHPKSLYATNLEITDCGYSGFAMVNGAGPYLVDGLNSYSNPGTGINLELTETPSTTTGGFQNITLKNITSHSNGAYGISVGTGTKTTVALQAAGYYYDTAGQTDNMGNIRLENAQVYGNTLSGVLVRGFEVMMKNIVSRENTEYGFIISQPYVGYAPIVNMDNCFAIKNTLDGFSLSGTSLLKTIVVANGCRAKDNVKYGFSVSESGLYQYLLFSDCEASGNTGTGGTAPFNVHTTSSNTFLFATNNCMGFSADSGRYDPEMHLMALPIAGTDATHIRIPKGAVIRKIAIDVDTADTGVAAAWVIRQSDLSVTYATILAANTGYRELVPTGNTLHVSDTDTANLGFVQLDAWNDGIQAAQSGAWVEDGSGTIYVEYWYPGEIA